MLTMKKIAFILVALMMSVAANAQFEKGKAYIGASLTNLDLSYNGLREGHFGLGGKMGYMVADDLLLTGQVAYEKQKDVPYQLSFGVGGRYYIVQNGLYVGLSGNYKHSEGYSDVLPSVQLGYALFLNGSVTVEPEIYYEQSFKNHKDYSTVGLRLGIGVYLFGNNK